ncbi:MAG: hypothetical protein U1F76_31045 [Candidatus Competibacteraceae bacterium]
MRLYRAVYQGRALVVPSIARFKADRSASLSAPSVCLPRQNSNGSICLRPALPVPGINSCRSEFHWLVLILCCCLVACTEFPRHSAATVRQWEQNSVDTLPRPGENLIIHPNFIRESGSCNDAKLPLVRIEKSELMPTIIGPGKEFNHRLVYIFCPRSKKSKPISGALYRRIYFQGRLVFEDVSKNYQFKPGKWSVDAFITVPPEIKTGNYALVVIFKTKNIDLQKNTSLVIEQPDYPVQIVQF